MLSRAPDRAARASPLSPRRSRRDFLLRPVASRPHWLAFAWCEHPIAQRISAPRALGRGGSRGKLELGLVNGAPGRAIDQNWIHGIAGVCIHKEHARAFRRKVLVAPGQQSDQDRREIAPARGGYI